MNFKEEIYYELNNFRVINKIDDKAIIRIEQYYPFNSELIGKLLQTYPNAKSVRWVQEEPQNMGAWNFLFPRLIRVIPDKLKLEFVGRQESPSPASGSSKKFQISQEEIIKKAFE